jgi:3alpha(or 20beta)-hydroxysteroid dehydrogenase
VNDSTPPSQRMRDKVAVVTGAANGQGAAEAALLAAEGAHVIALDREEPASAMLDGVTFHRMDVGSPDDWQRLADRLRGEHGRVDGLVNNAAVSARLPLLTTTPEDIERVMTVNLTGPLIAMRVLTPLMPSGSSIVNVGSVAALGANPGPYTVSKYALRGLSRTASLEYGPRGIRVNMVHPGFFDTKMVQAMDPDRRAAGIGVTVLGRIGQPAEIAPLVVFLLSDDSSYIVGAEIPVDGGRIAHGGAKGYTDVMEQIG